MAEPDGVTVNVSSSLEKVQVALSVAKKNNNAELRNAAESVLSALVLVLRKKNAVIPAAMSKFMHTIDKHVYAQTNKKDGT